MNLSLKRHFATNHVTFTCTGPKPRDRSTTAQTPLPLHRDLPTNHCPQKPMFRIVICKPPRYAHTPPPPLFTTATQLSQLGAHRAMWYLPLQGNTILGSQFPTTEFAPHPPSLPSNHNIKFLYKRLYYNKKNSTNNCSPTWKCHFCYGFCGPACSGRLFSVTFY